MPPELAGEKALVNVFQDLLTLEYEEHRLSRHSVEWQLDERNLARVGNPRLYQHPYQSPQLEMRDTTQVEWYVILRARPYGSRPRRKRIRQIVFLQLPRLSEGPLVMGEILA